ncbi:tyrosine recombinase XerC [Bacillaceae bacterium]
METRETAQNPLTYPPEIEMHIESFLAQLANAGRAAKTIQSYHHDLKLFFDWLLSKYPSVKTIRDVTRSQIYGFFGYLDRTRRNSYATRRRRMSSLGLFFHTLVHDGVIAENENPFPELKDHPIKQKAAYRNKPILYLEYDEMLRFMEAVFQREDKRGGRQPWMRARDICLFDLLLCTGLRISELCSLTVETAQEVTTNHLLGIVGKGDKYRPIPIARESHIQRIRDYLKQRPVTEETNALFLTKNLKPMQPRDIQYLIKTYMKRSKIQKNITPHKLRHTFASMLIKQDVDIRKIQLLLGHASISTTQIYTHINIQDQKAAIDKLPEW